MTNVNPTGHLFRRVVFYAWLALWLTDTIAHPDMLQVSGRQSSTWEDHLTTSPLSLDCCPPAAGHEVAHHPYLPCRQ
jgi:hypothetical protein